MGILKKYSNLSNWKLFFITALVLRLVMLSVIITLGHNWQRVVIQPDDGSYFSAVDNFLYNHCYCYIANQPFAGRMPGYSVVYFLFRLVLSPASSVIAVVMFQLLLSCISAYVLCLIAFKIFNSVEVSVITFFLYCISAFPAVFDLYIVAESLSASVFIITLYYLFTAFEPQKKLYKNLLISGIFLSWAIFLRPYIGIFIIIIPFYIIYKLYAVKTATVKNLFVSLIIFGLPFALCESAWVYRNYNATHRLILLEDDLPLSYGKIYSEPWMVIDNLVYTWGEDAANFDEGSPGSYFRNREDKTFKGFPARVFKNVTTYNNDSLVHLKQMYMRYMDTQDTNQGKALETSIIKLSTLYKEDYILHNRFAYYTYKPLACLKRLVLSGGYRYIQFKGGTASIAQKSVKIVSSLLYFFTLILGIIGLIWCFAKRIALPYLILFVAISLTLVLTIIFYSEIQEPRYFIDVFILWVPFSAYVFDKVLLKKHQVKSPA